MALTLVEAAKLHDGNVERSAIIEMYARSSNILMALPFENIDGNALKYNREEQLPGVGFRGVNEAYTESTGVINPVTEALAIAGGDLDVDKFIVDTMGTDQRTVQEAMKVKALAQKWTLTFFKGDSSTEPREFDGLQVRITGGQKISAGNTAGGTPLSLSKLDEAIDAVDNPTHLLMNRTLRRQLTAAARNTAVGGYITYQPDAFGRQIAYFNDLPILTVDLDGAGNEILPFNEATTSGAATGSSIYVVSLGEGMLSGIQNGTMEVRDLGELEAKPAYRSRVEWYPGIAVFYGRAAARLWSISNGAVTV